MAASDNPAAADCRKRRREGYNGFCLRMGVCLGMKFAAATGWSGLGALGLAEQFSQFFGDGAAEFFGIDDGDGAAIISA